ncbi:Alkaline phosphatase [Synechococcus sp. WH 8101]|nr:Alkaline phosphatase [Synechococcus sp. WH 8101]
MEGLPKHLFTGTESYLQTLYSVEGFYWEGSIHNDFISIDIASIDPVATNFFYVGGYGSDVMEISGYFESFDGGFDDYENVNTAHIFVGDGDDPQRGDYMDVASHSESVDILRINDLSTNGYSIVYQDLSYNFFMNAQPTDTSTLFKIRKGEAEYLAVDVEIVQFNDVSFDRSSFLLVDSDDGEEVEGGDDDEYLGGYIGDDDLIGGGGDDFLNGLDGDDYLYSGDGNDIVNAGDGDDVIVGGDGRGDDRYIGGEGLDSIVYSSSINAPIDVSLRLGTAEGQEIGNDTLQDIENVTLGQSDDFIEGDAQDNRVDGQGGFDTALFQGQYSEYSVEKTSNGGVVVSDSIANRDGIDTLLDVERLRFSDRDINTVDITVETKPSQLSVSTSGSTQTPVAQIVATKDVANANNLGTLHDLEIVLSDKAIDFKVEIDNESSTAIANISLVVLQDDLTLTTGDGKRDPSISPIYYAIDAQGALSPLSYDPLLNAGARFYDTDGDGIADFLSLKMTDGGFGDKDGVKNGVIDDPSAMGTVALDPVITALENGFLQVADAANAAPAAIALQASLTSRANAVTEIGYVILNEGEDASTVSDLTAFQERASLLFSALENKDVTLTEAMTFNSQFLLRNGQSIRFFSVTDGTLADLASLEDSRFSFIDGSVDATTGAASFSSASGIGFDLALLNSDQNLSALIAQEQHVAPLLDFTAFTNDETITGTIVQAREADYDAITGFYRVLDTSGSVRAADGSLLTPDDDGYAAAALLEANRISAFDNLSIADGESSSTEFSLQDASYIAPFAQVNGNTFFAYADANPDGLSHFRSLGSNLFGLEDKLGGGDLDYDDHIVGFSIGGLTPATPAVG